MPAQAELPFWPLGSCNNSNNKEIDRQLYMQECLSIVSRNLDRIISNPRLLGARPALRMQTVQVYFSLFEFLNPRVRLRFPALSNISGYLVELMLLIGKKRRSRSRITFFENLGWKCVH